ncbi:MAG: hypothetical protein ABW250_09880 [Pyrinomonadaceae bacterium]
MAKIAERLSVSNVKWVAGVHRHTAHPHIHLILHKEASDLSTGDAKRITRFPREMLNDRDEKGTPTAGLVNLEFSEAIDGLLRRERKPDGGNRDAGTAQIPGGSERPTAQNIGSRDEDQKVGSDHRPSSAADQRDNPEPQTTDAARAPASSPSEASERPAPGDPPTRTSLRPNLIEHMMLQEPQEPHRPEIPEQQPHSANSTQPPLPTAPAAQNLGNAESLTDHFLGNEQPDAAQPAEFSDEKFQTETQAPEGDRAADFISPAPNPFISLTPDEVSARDQASRQQPPDLDDSFDLDF